MRENNKSIDIEYERKIKEIDDFLFESYKNVDMYKHLTPTNLVEENNKFLESFKLGIEYNPVYDYKNNINDYESKLILNKIYQYRDELRKLKNENNEVYGILLKREAYMLEDLENTINLCNNIGNNDSNIDFYSKKIYGQPDSQLVQKAKFILENDFKSLENIDYTAEDCKRVFEDVLKQLNLNWKIKINEVQSSKMSVISEEKVISINAKAKFSKNDLKRLVVHEIGTHVLRAENGSKQPYKMFSLDIGKILYTEEGLATVNEEEYGVLDKRTFRIYAGRVIAISECMNKSFYEVFKLMLKYFSMQDALYIVSRVKRGIRYTKDYNVFVKDYVYLDGYYKVKKYPETHEKKELYTGIIEIDEIDETNKLMEAGILNQTKCFDLKNININI